VRILYLTSNSALYGLVEQLTVTHLMAKLFPFTEIDTLSPHQKSKAIPLTGLAGP
jgi:hypothetical protein